MGLKEAPIMQRKTIHMSEKIWRRLGKLAERDGLKIADLVRRAVIEFLKREEEND